MTKFGQVTVSRIAYRSPGRPNVHPADAALNLPEEKHSHGLRKLTAVEAARGSMEGAQAAVTRATGVTIGKRQVEGMARRAAAHVEAFCAWRVTGPAPDGWPLVLTFGKGIVMLPEALRPATAKAAASADGKLATRLSPGEKNGRKRMCEVADWHRDGTLAEFAAVEARNLAPLPGSVDFTAAASLPISGLTAWQGLFQHGRLRAGQSVLAHGAAGAVGSAVTQLARDCGAYVIGTGRAADRQAALGFGANEFLSLDDEDLQDIGGVDLVFDVIGGDIQRRSAGIVRPGGTLVSVVGPAQARPAGGLAVDFVVESVPGQLTQIVDRVRDGRFRTHIGTVATLDDAVPVLNPARRRTGKTVIRARPLARDGGRLYPAPARREVHLVGWSPRGDVMAGQIAVSGDQAAGAPAVGEQLPASLPGNSSPDDWTWVLVRAVPHDEGLLRFDSLFEVTVYPCELLWGPGTAARATDWLERRSRRLTRPRFSTGSSSSSTSGTTSTCRGVPRSRSAWRRDRHVVPDPCRRSLGRFRACAALDSLATSTGSPATTAMPSRLTSARSAFSGRSPAATRKRSPVQTSATPISPPATPGRRGRPGSGP
jgi:NADPH:quinone reductase-like Zn-dependent oxidoreductase